ncbi:MAG: cytochrome-c peroxidase [Deltaproteobacteria bacterium]|nr:cytochrome-c peroxidase [Deltaproteobacteria bacterium]
MKLRHCLSLLFGTCIPLLVGCDQPHPQPDAAAAPRHGNTKAQLVAEVRSWIAYAGIEPIAPAPAVAAPMFELGRALSFDKILSGNHNISCLTCHHPDVGSDDDRSLPAGEGGAGLGAARSGGHIIPRNAPALFNMHTYDTMFWNSRVELDAQGNLSTPAGAQLTPQMAAVFEHGVVSAQAMFPVTSREEMRGLPGDNELADIPDGDFGAMWSALMARLGAVPQYVAMFEAAYPGTPFGEMSFAHAANAIAAFEIAAFESRDSPWDAFVQGDDDALTNKQLRGAVAFFEVGCVECHAGSGLSDFAHHNTGLAQFGPGKGDGPTGTDDFGREQVTGDPLDRYAFRTPPLFNVELTGPFGHDGQYDTLERITRHYVDPDASLLEYEIEQEVDDAALWGLQLDNAAQVLDVLDPVVDALDFGSKSKSKKKVKRIKAFLKALTGEGARDLGHLVPPSVPSGLPVAD